MRWQESTGGGGFISATVWGFRRAFGDPMRWTVSFDMPRPGGAGCINVSAVVDDFGNLVRVTA